MAALVYIASQRGEGMPRPGYIHLVVRGGARLGVARALHPFAATLVAVGMARRAGEGHRRGRMSAQAIRHVVIRGRVQGVGYRAWTEYTALDHGLEGWVRNRRDGSVEAVFAGPPEAVEAMVAACRHGPPGARVDAMDERRSLARGTRTAPSRRALFGSVDGVSATLLDCRQARSQAVGGRVRA